MKVYLDELTEKFEDEIIKYIDHEILYNCNFNGMKYEIIHHDYTCVTHCEEIDATNLLDGIYAIMEGQANEIY